MLVNIKEVLKSDTALTPSSGEVLFNILEKELSENKEVTLDFHGMEIITSAFLNAAVGRLYFKFSPLQLNKFLNVSNIATDDLALLKKVIERAKSYFQDQESFNRRLDGELE